MAIEDLPHDLFEPRKTDSFVMVNFSNVTQVQVTQIGAL